MHGFDRGGELDEAIDAKTARVVEFTGRITGYAGNIAFFAHGVAETNQGLEALIGAAPAPDQAFCSRRETMKCSSGASTVAHGSSCRRP